MTTTSSRESSLIIKSASQNAENADKQREAAHSGKENNDLAFFVPIFQREVTSGLGANTDLLSLLNLTTILSANRYPTCILERHSPLSTVFIHR